MVLKRNVEVASIKPTCIHFHFDHAFTNQTPSPTHPINIAKVFLQVAYRVVYVFILGEKKGNLSL